MAQEYDQALTFMTPSYQNSPRSKRFRGEFAGASFWQSAEVKWAKCDEEAEAPWVLTMVTTQLSQAQRATLTRRRRGWLSCECLGRLRSAAGYARLFVVDHFDSQRPLRSQIDSYCDEAA
jgi:hypothetical protein